MVKVKSYLLPDKMCKICYIFTLRVVIKNPSFDFEDVHFQIFYRRLCIAEILANLFFLNCFSNYDNILIFLMPYS